MKNSIYEVLNYGPIVACDEELGILITVNGSYLNFWSGNEVDGYRNTDCQSVGTDLYKLSVSDAMDKAEQYILEQKLEAYRDDIESEIKDLIESFELPDDIPEDEKFIDIRLCVEKDGSWIIRTGDASYDQRHSDYCAASSYNAETDASKLTDELINQLFE